MSPEKTQNMSQMLDRLGDLLAGQRRLLIVLHNQPDPDAIASAAALALVAEEKFGLRATMTYGGLIGRAENRAMVRELNIPLKPMGRVNVREFRRVAMVDTQPGAGNNSLPADVPCHIVVDHHPRRRGIEAELTAIDPKVGATATIFVEWLRMSELPLSSDLATALTYAIRSETLELGREATKRDVEAYVTVFPLASMRKLGRIAHPKVPRSYFVVLAEALKRAETYRNMICAHLGDVPAPEAVAEMADMLLLHRGVSWSFCSGRFGRDLIISLRTTNRRGRAGRVIRRLVTSRKNVGGHDMFAGGRIELSDIGGDASTDVERSLSDKLAGILGHERPHWKPLLDI